MHEPVAAISCTGVTKVYATGALALQDLTLTIPRGASFGLLGANGAGKSTFVRLALGFIRPTTGEVRVLGEVAVQRAHPRVGYVPERVPAERRFTARRYLAYLGQLAGLWGAANRQRVAAVLEEVGLAEAADARVETYSKGMLQRLGIAQALLPDPDLLILDEPTGGLDPASQWAIRRAIAARRRRGATILLCSHYLAEVEELCDAIGILHRGHLALSGALADLVRREGMADLLLGGDRPARDVCAEAGIAPLIVAAEGQRVRFPTHAQPPILAALVDHQVPIVSLTLVQQSLEEVYLRATEASTGADAGVAPATHTPAVPTPAL